MAYQLPPNINPSDPTAAALYQSIAQIAGGVASLDISTPNGQANAEALGLVALTLEAKHINPSSLTSANVSIDTDPKGHSTVAAAGVVLDIKSGAIDPFTSDHAMTILVANSSLLRFANSPGVDFTVIGGSGLNQVTLNKGPSSFTSTTGYDTVRSRGGKDTITGGSGSDTIYAGRQSLIKAGTLGDKIIGTFNPNGNDTIIAGSGADTIKLHAGNNSVQGTTGNSFIQAGSGYDTIQGGTGAETILGSGHTLIFAGDGNQISATGNDTVVGSGGKDTISSVGDPAGDGQSITGGSGKLTVNVDNYANDTIFGSGGNVVVNLSQFASSIIDPVTGKAGDPANKFSDLTPDADGVTTIHFTSGQTLSVKDVTIKFSDNTHHRF